MTRLATLLLIAACSLPLLAGCGAATGVAPVSRVARKAPTTTSSRSVPAPAKAAAPSQNAAARGFITQLGATAPAFSPKGDQMLFETPQGLMAAQPNGQSPRAVPGSRADDQAPAYSADGGTVAFIRRNGTRSSSLMRLIPGSGQVAPLYETTERIQAVAWAPDGRALIYVTAQGDQATLYRLPVPGNMPARLWQGTGATSLTVSPAGTIVFDRTDASGIRGLAQLPVAGGTAQKLDVVGANPHHPSFSPTGRSLAYVADGGLFVAQANGLAGSRVGLGDGLTAPAWNPKASSLIVAAPRGTRSDLQLVELPKR